MGRRRGGRTLNPAALRSVVADELAKALSGAPRTAANPTAQPAAMSSTPDTFGQLAGMMRSLVGYQARPMARDPRDSGPFGPMHPMPPDAISPARADTGRPEPWLYEYPVAWNIPGQGERLMPWRILREASRNIDVVRRCIEIRKSRVKSAPWSWDISPQAIADAYRADGAKGHDDVAAELRDRFRADINRLTEFWRKPWRANGLKFGQWTGGVMEGRLKYDASVLYPRMNLGGDTLLGFEIIDATCYSDDTEVLTGRGWLRFADVTADDVFATRNQKTKAFEWQGATYFHRASHAAPMYHFTSRSVDLLVTGNHRMLVDSLPRALGGSRFRERGEVIVPAAELAAHGNGQASRIPMTSRWSAPDLTEFRLSATGRTTSMPFACSGDDFAAFMGMYLAEGCYTGGDQVMISQMPESKGFTAYRDLLARIFGREVCHTGKSFVVGRKCLHEYLRQFGRSHEKYVPGLVKNMSARQLRIFWDFYMLGDGHYTASGHESIATTSPRLADDLQEIAQKIGMSASVSRGIDVTDTVMPGGRVILATNKRPKYTVYLSATSSRTWRVKTEPYDGEVFCVSVPNEILYVRRNGKAAWCGNTIKPLLDYRGSRPEPPFPAFQQILYGFPRGEWHATPTEIDNGDGTTTTTVEGAFRADELVYLRDNYIENTPYGYGPTEQALIAARLWMRRQGWLLAEYTDGVTPQLIWELPLEATNGATLTPEQRVEWESSVNDQLSGQTAERHRSKVGFPGMVPHLMPSVDERYKPEYDLFLLKLMCSFFGVPVSDLGFTETRGLGGSGMHASQAENRADVSTDPDLLFIADLVDSLGHEYQAAPPELLFSFTDTDGGQDESQRATIRAGEIQSGQKTLNDGRRELSLAPYPFREADMPYVLGTNGPVFIEGSLAASQRAQGLGPDGKPLPQPSASEVPPGGGPQDGAQGGDSATKAAPPLCKVIRDQLAPDYPSDATMWVKDANWTGPLDVPPNRLDLDDVKSWDAYGDTAKVDKFRKAMQRPGALKPIVAVTVPGDARVKVIDGHHRALAAVREGLPVRAYVGAVDAKVGPWTRMHAMQHAGGAGDGVEPVSAPPAGTAKAVVIDRPRPHEPSHAARAEIGAYHRWAAKATTGGRPFRMEHAEPADFPDGVPAGVEFADWMWVGPDGDLVKAYEPWWPRDERGKWIKRGSFAGLEDKIRALHDKHMAERDRLDVQIVEHRDKLRVAEMRANSVGTDFVGHRDAARAEVETRRARIAELSAKRDKVEQRRKDSASAVLARHEAVQRKARHNDANRATVGTMEDTRTPAERAGDLISKIESLGSREAAAAEVGGIKRADLNAMASALNIPRHRSLRGDELRREIVDATVGRRLDTIATRGFEGLRFDSPTASDPMPVGYGARIEQDMRAAYARIAQRGQWASVADLRDATPHLSRAEQDAAFRRLALADDANVVPESNQKALSERERAAAVVIGDQHKHMVMIGGPSLGDEPASVTAPTITHGVPSDVVAAKLRGVTSRAEAGQYLDGLKLKVPQYRQLAKDLGVPVSTSDSKARIREYIIEGLVGRRLEHDAIMRFGTEKAAAPDPKAPAPQAGAPQPPPDDRWPGWAVDTAIAATVAAALTATLIRGLSIPAVARAAAETWPAGSAPSVGAVLIWLRDRYGADVEAAVRPVIADALAEGYLVGERSAAAILDAGIDAREPGGITISVDWSHWRPGDARAARQVLSADGMTVGLQDLLDRAGVTIKGIAAQRLDELAAVLADGLERGESPATIARALQGIVANPTWANTVAWTETARAQSAAASEIYRQRGVAQSEWMTARDQRVCPLCAANDVAGPIDVGLPFPSGDIHPPGHPRCRCALIPVLPEIGKMVWAELLKVGPKGYVHGWIKVGAPGVKGERVHHPELGHGTVTRTGTATTGVTFDSGAYHAFEHGGTGDGHFVERAAKVPTRKVKTPAAPGPQSGGIPTDVRAAELAGMSPERAAEVIGGLKRDEMVSLARHHGLPVSGNKATLAARLTAHHGLNAGRAVMPPARPEPIVKPPALASPGDKVKAEFARQAALAPKTYARLRGIDAPAASSSQGRTWLREHGDEAGARYDPITHRVELSPKLGTPAQIKLFEQGRRGGYLAPLSPGSSHEAMIIAHEYGHHVVSRIHPLGGPWQRADADKIFGPLAQELGVAPPRMYGGGAGRAGLGGWLGKPGVADAVRRKVSGYAADNVDELLAEIWSEYSTAGANARPLARRIGPIIGRIAESKS